MLHIDGFNKIQCYATLLKPHFYNVLINVETMLKTCNCNTEVTQYLSH